ncbi:hypothetical protein C8Q80DRAFT_1188360 [Daedaleopsis nitida]|nr:hypothetical protein C8Q80DRAFT_1188360 [Daedaleopsis nitida]
MTTVYEQPLRYLKNFYTNDFNSWINNSPNWVPEGWDNAAAIGVVNLARLSEEHSILPLALLACTTLGEEVAKGFTREDGSQEKLTPEDLGLCFAAQAEIRKASLTILLRTLTYAPQCKESGPCRAALNNALVGLRDCVDDIIDGDPFSSYLVYLEDGKIGVCSACKAALKSLNWEERVKMWKTLPEIMGVDVPDWAPEARDVQ